MFVCECWQVLPPVLGREEGPAVSRLLMLLGQAHADFIIMRRLSTGEVL